MLKQYLNSNDLNSLLFINYLIETNSKILEDWKANKAITTEEAKYLKTSITYTEKFLVLLMKRMPTKEVEKFYKRHLKAQNEPIKILNNWMHNRIMGTYETEHQIVKIERPSLEKLATCLMDYKCEDCTDSYDKCDIYEIMEDNLIPRYELLTNCPYAFLSKETINKIEEANKKREKANKKSSKRANKKLKRFDEDDDFYEYNFESKIK